MKPTLTLLAALLLTPLAALHATERDVSPLNTASVGMIASSIARRCS
jgi:hypothetical protein